MSFGGVEDGKAPSILFLSAHPNLLRSLFFIELLFLKKDSKILSQVVWKLDRCSILTLHRSELGVSISSRKSTVSNDAAADYSICGRGNVHIACKHGAATLFVDCFIIISRGTDEFGVRTT